MQWGGSKTAAGDKEKPSCFFTFPSGMEGENSAEDISVAFVGPEFSKILQYISPLAIKEFRESPVWGGSQGPPAIMALIK